MTAPGRPAARAVRDCRACTAYGYVSPHPCPAAGPDRPRAVLVAQNPARAGLWQGEPLRGAFRLHSACRRTPRTANEEKVRALVAALGLRPAEVYATQAYKCPTDGNRVPAERPLGICARRWLLPELAAVPAVLYVAVGAVAARVLRAYLPGPARWEYPLAPPQPTVRQEYAVRLREAAPRAGAASRALVLEVPHPVAAGRFFALADWLAGAAALRGPAGRWRLTRLDAPAQRGESNQGTDVARTAGRY